MALNKAIHEDWKFYQKNLLRLRLQIAEVAQEVLACPGCSREKRMGLGEQAT